jgi:hypothetical protein
MQQGRTAGKSFRPQTFKDFYDSPHPVQSKIARVIARAKKGLTAYEIQDLAGCSVYSVRTVLKTMKAIEGVYIVGWRRTAPTALTALYAMGSLPDVEKPASVRDQELVRKKVGKFIITPVAAVEASPEMLHYKALAEALVPKRNEQEQREVNSMYLNHISGGAYG